MSTVRKEEIVKMKPRLLRRTPYITQTVGSCVSIFIPDRAPINSGDIVHEIVCPDGAIEIVKAGEDIGPLEGRHVIERVYRVGIMLALSPETGIGAGEKLYQVADDRKLILVPESAKAARGIA